MNNKKNISKFFLSSFIFFLLFGLCRQTLAAGDIIPDDTESLDSFIILAINISKYILGIVGSLTLLMFVVGGVQFMVSAGATEAVSKAKKTIVAAIVGLLIVFSSWLIISFVIKSLDFNPTNDPTWNWSVIPTIK